MKVDGGMATGTILQKVKVKEEARECCGFQQSSVPTAATSTSSGSPSIATATGSSSNGSNVVHDSNGVANVAGATTPTSGVSNASGSTASVALHQPSAIVCHPSAAASSVHVNADPFPVDLDLKTKAKGSTVTREKSTRDDAQTEVPSPSSHPQRIPAGPPTGQSKPSNGAQSDYKGTAARSVSSDSDSPTPSSHTLKPETEDAIGPGSSVAVAGTGDTESGGSGSGNGGGGGTANANCRTEEKDDAPASFASITGGRCIASVFAGHGELKSVLGTVVKFATGISPDTGDTVLTLVLALLSGSMTAEEFHSALQEATNYSLKDFVLPHLKQQLPSLQRDLSGAARASNQSCAQFLRSHEAAVLEAVGLVATAEPVEVFGEHTGNGVASGNSGNQCPAHYGTRSNSNPGVGAIQHTNNATGGLHHYSSAGSHAPKRRASDTPYYENGTAIPDDVPVYGKRPTAPWSHHHPPQQQPSTESSSPYCWYHPLHASSGSIQGHGHRHTHGHGTSPIPPGSVQMNQMNAFPGTHHLIQQPQQQISHVQPQNGSLDDEWKNIHMMLNCILGMVEKTKKALAILQTRGCFGTAAAAAPLQVPSQNGGSGNASNPSSTNGSLVESSTGDREGSLKRLSGEIVAQTIRAIEDKVAEVKRKDEEAVKRAVMAEVQRAVRVAVAESRATERLRMHRLLDVPLSQRSHPAIRQGPYLRVHGNSGPVEGSVRTVATPSAASNSIPSTSEDEKDPHVQNVSGSSCWNCGRPALETCGGCGVARYCGSFCQHRDWEAGGHHATCNNPPPREPRRSASRSPPRIGSAVLSTSANESNVAAPIPASVATKGK